MRYLPYFLIVLGVILLVFAGLLWLKPDPATAMVVIKRELSEETYNQS